MDNRHFRTDRVLQQGVLQLVRACHLESSEERFPDWLAVQCSKGLKGPLARRHECRCLPKRVAGHIFPNRLQCRYNAVREFPSELWQSNTKGRPLRGRAEILTSRKKAVQSLDLFRQTTPEALRREIFDPCI